MRKQVKKIHFLKFLYSKTKFFLGLVFLLALILFVLGNYSAVLSGQLEFYSITDYPVGATPYYLISADLNNDDNLDLVTANRSDDSVSVLLGTGTGGFGATTDYITAGGASGNVWVEAAYLNADSYLDLVTANNITHNVSVLLNNGNGTFSPSIEYPANSGTSSVFARDLNNDSYLDLLVSNLTGNNVSILLGVGDGTFGVKTDYPTGLGPWLSSPADLNNDGNLDIITVNEFASTISVLFGNGNGTFQAKTDYSAGPSSWAIKLADFNQDNILDAITTNVGNNTFSVLLGDGLGGFLAPSFYTTGTIPWYPSVADLDLDGYLDIVILNFGSDNISIYRGKGDGTFENPIIYATNVEPSDIESADFNNDGIIDFAVASQKGGVNSTVTVFLNRIFNTYCSLSPSNVTSGGQVTIDATTTFTATSVWAEIEKDNNLMTTVNLNNIGGNNYSKVFTTTSDYLGDNDVTVFATDGIDISVCSPSTGASWQVKTVNDIPWYKRSGHRSVSFNDRIYVVGGIVDDFISDVWSSADGISWNQDTANAAWTKRAHVGLTVFDNKMWLMGGNNYVDGSDTSTYTYFKDVWFSANGSDWTLANDNAPWGERAILDSTEFNGSLWLSGGLEKAGLTFTIKDDVWTSPDGANWTCVAGSDPGCGLAPGWGIRFGHQMFTYNNKLWVIGGKGNAYDYHDDVWSSTDGVTWVCESGSAPGCLNPAPGWGNPNPGENGRYLHKVLIHDQDGSGPLPEKMWLMGGSFKLDAPTREVNYNDVWSSIDGINWTLEIDPGFEHQPVGVSPSNWTHWTARRNFAGVVHDAGAGDEMWVLGGYEFRVRSWNDVWHSSDGVNWNLNGNNYDGIMGTRFDPQMFAYDDKLWIIGGLANGLGEQNDVWSSVDGENWICESGVHPGCLSASPWDARWGHQVLVYDNKMWMIGGCTGNYTAWCQSGVRSRDVWYSTDGRNWTQATPAANYTWSNWPTAEVYDNKMWLIGGWVPGIGYDNQVWSSTDGITWIASADGPWAGRTAPESVVYNDGTGEKIYFMGGVVAPTTRFNDVWSFDGTTWVQETPAAAWDTRYAFGLVNYNNKMWVFGGNAADYYLPALWSDDVWWSTDGDTWTAATMDAEFTGRDFFEATVFNNKIWLGFGDSNGGSNDDVWASKFDTLVFSVNPSGGITVPTGSVIEIEAPINLTCYATNSDSLVWNFEDQADNETGFRLYQPNSFTADIKRKEIDEVDLSEISETNLDTNTQYIRYATAFKIENNAEEESSPSNQASCYTLANVPNMPGTEIGEDYIIVILNPEDGNPEGTEYAIFEANTGNYVQVDGSFSEFETWLSDEDWGGQINVIGSEQIETQFSIALDTNQEYNFAVKARNGDGIETAFSPGTTGEITGEDPVTPPDQEQTEVAISKGVAINISQGQISRILSKAVFATSGQTAQSVGERLIIEFSLILNIILVILIVLLLFSIYEALKQIQVKGFGNKMKIALNLLHKEPAVIFADQTNQDKKGTYKNSYGSYKKLHEYSQKTVERALGIIILKLIVLVVLILGVAGVNHQSIAQLASYDQAGQDIQQGDILSYQISFANQGDTVATNVVITDIMDTYVSYVNGSGILNKGGEEVPGGFNIINQQINFTVGDLAPSQTGYALFDVQVSSDEVGRQIANQGQISGDNFNSQISNTVTNTITETTEPVQPPDEPIEPPVVPPTPPDQPVDPPTPPEPPVVPPTPPTPPEQPVVPPPTPPDQPSTPPEPGVVSVLQTEFFDNQKVEDTSLNIITPILLALAALNTIPTVLMLVSNILMYLHLLFFEPLLWLFRKKRNKWGVVYDALSKLPVDLAVVRLFSKDDNRLVQTKVTDKKGRYLMIIKNPGKYYLSVSKPGYVFPTLFLKESVQDTKYLDLYHGEEIEINEKNIALTANIPLDLKDKKVASVKEIVRSYLINNLRLIVSYIGISLAVLVVLIIPTAITIGALIVHLILFVLFRRLIVPKKPKSWGIIYDSKTKKPIKQAVIKIFDLRFNKLLEAQVSDSKGRYAFLVGKNEYQMLTEKSGYQRKQVKPVDLVRNEEIINLDVGLDKETLF
jgi:uncharacterized repeat protein (TIGR01451 family)